MERVPDYIAPIAGARSWRLAPTLMAQAWGYLYSHAMTTAWPTGEEMVARCDSGHPAPGENCSCGVYAWRSARQLLSSGYQVTDPKHISGVAAGAGRFIEGERGYWVAERVVVLAFFEDDFPTPARKVGGGRGVYLPTKEGAAEAYDVPLIAYEDFEDFCDEYKLIRLDDGGR